MTAPIDHSDFDSYDQWLAKREASTEHQRRTLLRGPERWYSAHTSSDETIDGFRDWVGRNDAVEADIRHEQGPGETRITSETGGQKGAKAQQFSQIPTPSLMALAETYSYGASKYSRFNFRNGYDYSLSFDAMQRHAWAWNDSEDLDPESGLNHMAHVAWHALNLLQMQADPELEHMFDDRYKGRD